MCLKGGVGINLHRDTNFYIFYLEIKSAIK